MTTWRRALRDTRHHTKALVGLALLSVAAAPIALLLPVPLKLAVDSGINNQPIPDGFATGVRGGA